MKKALSLILALIMTVGIIPTAAIGAFAESAEAEQSSTAKEIPADAIKISTAEELLAIKGAESGKYYVLSADIDLSTADGAKTFYNSPIVLNNSTFDGDGHSITGFRLQSGAETVGANLSLFTVTGACTVKDLTVGSDETRIEVGMSNANTSYAIVMADIPGGTTQSFENVTVYADMTGDPEVTADNRRGAALIGRVFGNVNITNCETYGSITDTQGKTGYGGFIGLIRSATVKSTSVIVQTMYQ